MLPSNSQSAIINSIFSVLHSPSIRKNLKELKIKINVECIQLVHNVKEIFWQNLNVLGGPFPALVPFWLIPFRLYF